MGEGLQSPGSCITGRPNTIGQYYGGWGGWVVCFSFSYPYGPIGLQFPGAPAPGCWPPGKLACNLTILERSFQSSLRDSNRGRSAGVGVGWDGDSGPAWVTSPTPPPETRGPQLPFLETPVSPASCTSSVWGTRTPNAWPFSRRRGRGPVPFATVCGLPTRVQITIAPQRGHCGSLTRGHLACGLQSLWVNV